MKNARGLMTSPAKTLSPAATLTDAAAELARANVGSMPIVDGNILVGVITDRDIVVKGLAEGHDPATTSVADVATTGVVSVGPDADAGEVARLLADHQIRRIPVVEAGEVLGVISQADVALELDNSTAGEVVEKISQ